MAISTPESSQNMSAVEAEVTSVRKGEPEDSRTAPFRLPEIEVPFSLMRQSSIYSLTLDEIQNTVCESGKNFGSMNMDEFLTNIWNAEEGVDAPGPASHAHPTAGELPLNRQGSLSLPSKHCRKTVDEVWAEIHGELPRGRQRQQLHKLDCPNNTNDAAVRQPTFGEMTLEDFLIKAGVVSEGYCPAAPSPQSAAAPAPQQYGLAGYTMGANAAPDFGHVYGGGAVSNGRRGELYCYSGDVGGEGRIGNGYEGLQLGIAGSSASPISSDGLGGSGGGVDSYGLGMDGFAGKSGGRVRKRMVEGVVEKVVERRQRRMIKNRESAARSRARKQAYTVELEAELNLLKEENARLREEERMVRQLRKQMLLESMTKQAPPNMGKTSCSLKRCNSSPS